MNGPSQPKHVPHFLCSRVAPAVLDNPRHRGAAGSRVGLLLLSTAKFLQMGFTTSCSAISVSVVKWLAESDKASC